MIGLLVNQSSRRMKDPHARKAARDGFLLRLRPQWKQNHSTQVEAMRATQPRQPGNFIYGNMNVAVLETSTRGWRKRLR